MNIAQDLLIVINFQNLYVKNINKNLASHNILENGGEKSMRKGIRVSLIILVVILILSIFSGCIEGGEYIFGASISNNSNFQVKLVKDVKYELRLVELPYCGPETVDVSISRGSYVALEEKFRLMPPEGDYIPYRKKFTVRENGTYQIDVKPLDSGSFRIGIKQYS